MTAPGGPARGTKARAARLGRPGAPSARVEPVEPVERVEPGERELTPDELVALEEQRAFLLASLRDLEAEHDAGDIDDADYDALDDDYTARAAAVIRAIDGHHALVAARRRPVSWTRRIAAVAVVVVLAVGAGVFVAHSSGQRNAGDTITGGARESSRDLLLAAREKQGQQDYDGAIAIYDQVLQADPANVEALAFRGWMHRLKALAATPQDQVELLQSAVKDEFDALAVQPDDGPALVFLAVLYGDTNNPQKALDTLARIPAGGVPDEMSSLVESFRQQMQAELTALSTTTTSTG